MEERVDELIPTRATLIHRLKDWQDQASWQEFFDTYWKLIYRVAIQGGLTNTEAEDVVQQTMISVAKHMPNFKYDPALGTFKTWLLNMTRWRITDKRRQRQPHSVVYYEPPANHEPDDEDHEKKEQLRKLPPSLETAPDLEKLWDSEWEKNLLAAATANARRRVDLRQYQIFDCHVNKGWPVERVAQALGISANQVYLAKHRVSELINEEAERLQKEVI
jgi:RNA polymerase sigma-70 factor (ECF subfamily)